MGITRGVVQQLSRVGTGLQSFTVSGLGAAGNIKAYTILWGRGGVAGTAIDHAALGFGAGDMTRQWGVCAGSRHLQASSATQRVGTTTASIIIINPDGPAIEGVADLNAAVTDGIQLDWTTIPATQRLITVSIFADDGSDLSAYAEKDSHTGSQNTSQDFFAALFEPDVIFQSSPNTDFTGTLDTGDGIISVGLGSNETSIVQACLASQYLSAQPSSVNTALLHNARIQSGLNNGVINRSLELTAFGTNGFSLTKREGAATIHFGYLALNFNSTLQFKLDLFDTPTSGQRTITTGFEPGSLLVLQSYCDTINTAETVGTQGAGALAVGVVEVDAEYCHGMSSEDNVAETDDQSLTDVVAANFARDDGSIVLECTGPSGLGAFGATSFTLDFTTHDATPRKWAALAIEATVDAVVPVVPLGSLALTGVGR